MPPRPASTPLASASRPSSGSVARGARELREPHAEERSAGAARVHERGGDDAERGAGRGGRVGRETRRDAFHGGLEVAAEVAVAALPVEIVEQFAAASANTSAKRSIHARIAAAVEGVAHRRHQVSAGVRTGASQSSASSSSRRTTVSEQPDMSSDVT